MNSILALHAENYRIHPSFHFGQASWDLPMAAFQAFNSAYGAAKEMGYLMSASSFNAVRRTCESALRDVFDAFRKQCADDHEKQFVNELDSQCERILAVELDWYGKKRSQVHSHLKNRQTWDNALRLYSLRHYFGQLPAAAVGEIQVAAAEDVVRFRANAAAGKLTREDLSVNTGPAVAKIRGVLNKEFRALGVLETLSAYTGRKMRVVGMALELSVPQATWWRNVVPGISRAPDTLYAHLDESIHCPKSIVYLSDVMAENGPTSVYPSLYEKMELNPLQEMIGRVVIYIGNDRHSALYEYYGRKYHQSGNSENYRRHFMRLPEAVRFHSHMGWDVAPDTPLEREMANCEKRMIGPAGTFVVFDGGRLMHRGGLVQSGERIALQVIFSEPNLTRRAINRFKRMIA
jgi:hypothetical protein